MRSLNVVVPPSKAGRPITLHVVSCIHVGHKSHQREETLALFDRILQTPDHYLVNLGDTGDNGTKHGPGASVYEQVINPFEQAIVIAAIFRPLVDAKKVLWWHDSNHSLRTYKESGFWTMEETVARLFFGSGIAETDWHLLDRYAAGEFVGRNRATIKKRVDVETYFQRVLEKLKPDANPRVRWAGWQAITKLRAGQQTYTFHSMHGEGGGTAISSALNAVAKQREAAEADIYLRGHHHKKIAADASRGIWNANGKAEFRRIGFLTTGCYLGYHDSYAEARGYPPNATGEARIVLHTGKKWGFELQV